MPLYSESKSIAQSNKYNVTWMSASLVQQRAKPIGEKRFRKTPWQTLLDNVYLAKETQLDELLW